MSDESSIIALTLLFYFSFYGWYFHLLEQLLEVLSLRGVTNQIPKIRWFQQPKAMIIKDIKGFVFDAIFKTRTIKCGLIFSKGGNQKHQGRMYGIMTPKLSQHGADRITETLSGTHLALPLVPKWCIKSSSWKIMVTSQITFPMALETQMCLGEQKKCSFFPFVFSLYWGNLYDDPTHDKVKKCSLLIRQFSYFKKPYSYTIVICIIWRKWHFYTPVLFDYSGIS